MKVEGAEQAEPDQANPLIAGRLDASLDTADCVETALADALTKAATAGRFDVVAQLARELEARRMARVAANVIDLDGARRRGR